MSRLRKVAEGNYYNAWQIAQKNEKIVKETGETTECVGFEWQGFFITNPFKDETGRVEVDPVKYYGESFMNSDFAK